MQRDDLLDEGRCGVQLALGVEHRLRLVDGCIGRLQRTDCCCSLCPVENLGSVPSQDRRRRWLKGLLADLASSPTWHRRARRGGGLAGKGGLASLRGGLAAYGTAGKKPRAAACLSLSEGVS